jgi:hypothetical protein
MTRDLQVPIIFFKENENECDLRLLCQIVKVDSQENSFTSKLQWKLLNVITVNVISCLFHRSHLLNYY